MVERRSDYDVTGRIKVTDPAVVMGEIRRIYQDLYQSEPAESLVRSFDDAACIFRGEQPGFLPCDTSYHNIQHTLDVTLAMARLMDGYERRHGRRNPLGADLFQFGVVAALFHDFGYIRHKRDVRHRHGAEYTLRRVSRGARFLERYLPSIGLAEFVSAAAPVVHFTGYEIPVERIHAPAPIFRQLGNLLGSADILAQMADRCYLEKCRDRLYPEFVLGGIARRRGLNGEEEVVFSSATDLVNKTPWFYRTASQRLKVSLEEACRYAVEHFDGQNLYLDEIERNIRYAECVAEAGDVSLLRRRPPETHAAF